MSGVLAVFRVAWPRRVKGETRGKRRRRRRLEEEARRSGWTETVVVTPGAVQLQTRSPLSDVTGRCIQKAILLCPWLSLSFSSRSRSLSFRPSTQPAVVLLALHRVIVLISWSRYQVSLHGFGYLLTWRSLFTCLFYGVKNGHWAPLGRSTRGFGLK